MTAPSLAAETYQFLDTGVLLNSSPSLPFVDINEVDGLDSAPLRLQTHDGEGMDGGYVDSFYETIRTVTLNGEIYASVTALETYLDSLKANWAPTKTPQPFYFGVDIAANVTRMVFGKSQGLRYNKDTQRRVGIVPVQFQLLCEDPRMYDTALTQTAATAYSAGTATLTLSGNRTTPGTITLKGPATNPTFTLGGVTFTFAITLITTDTLVVDLSNKSVILNGTTNKRSTLTISGGLWYLLSPGANVFTFTNAGTGTIQFAGRSAWR